MALGEGCSCASNLEINCRRGMWVSWQIYLFLLKNPKQKQVRLVQWKKSASGWFKLIVDGSYLGTPGCMGAGGLIRNDEGKLQVAFSISLGHGTNNVAELMALLHGLRYCRDLDIRKLEVELDSLLVVQLEYLDIPNSLLEFGYLDDFWEEIQDVLSSRQFVFRHIFRECNAGADFLSRMVPTTFTYYLDNICGYSSSAKGYLERPSFLEMLVSLFLGVLFGSIMVFVVFHRKK